MPSLYFQETGHGPSLVLLHGFCETHEIWTNFVKPLASKFHVFMPDLPGFGQSESLLAPFTIDDVGKAIAKWMTETNISTPIIIGHSLGGYVALSLAYQQPETLRAFGLFHSTVFADSQEKKENRNKVIEFVTRNGVQLFIDAYVPGLFFNKSNESIPMVRRIASQTKADTLIGYSKAMRDRPDRSIVLSKNKCRKLLIAGAEDTLVPIEISRQMAKIGQNLAFSELAATGHMGIFEAETEAQMITKQFAEQVFFNN